MVKVSFPTIFTNRLVVYTNPGNRIKKEYTLLIDKETGVESLKYVGDTDIYLDIQASKDSTDINKLVERYKNGEIDVLTKKPGVYGDFVNMPTSMAEMLDFVSRGNAFFDGLPNDVKAAYNFSASQFFADFGSDHYMEVIKEYNQPPLNSVDHPDFKPLDSKGDEKNE